MGAVTGKFVLGAIAGAFIGLVALCVLDQSDPPVDPKLLLAAICLGAFLGAVLGAAAGQRSVSVFWLYLVLIFGVITIIPWWHGQIKSPQGLIGTYFPLGWAYVNSPNQAIVLFVLLPHTLISIALAAVSTVAHKKLVARFAKQTDN